MIIYPAIDLRQGRCVRLHLGQFDRETVYGDDPLEVARRFAAAGAKWLHVVDLDGAKGGAAAQSELIWRLTAAGASIQTGGGIRDAAAVAAHFEHGVARVVIGSLALFKPDLVKDWIRQHGAERIVLALDVRPVEERGYAIATHGWQQQTASDLFPVLEDFAAAGLSHLLCTDISRDGALEGPNLALYRRLKVQFPAIDVQASGGIARLADLQDLRDLGIAAAVIGRALYERKFTLAEALAC
jgi:phosphoribosylformimino-5-aminoimidazole carboxamide ribotide isomerase